MKSLTGFWPLVMVVFIISLLGAAAISFAPTYFTDPIIDNGFSFENFWSQSENARTILSSLSEIQAAIFSIFFSLYFIISQLQIQSKAASPRLAKEWTRSGKMIFIILVYVFSISFDLFLIRLIEFRENLKIDIFCAILFFIFSLLVLLIYMRSNLLGLFNKSLIEEILSGSCRYDLEEAELNNLELNKVNLYSRRLIRSKLNSSSLKDSFLSGADLSEARLNEVDASNAEMSSANFFRADLASAIFNNTKLCKCDISEANLKGLTANKANLREAKLNWSDLSEANFIGADFSKSNLFFTKMIRANLSQANMREANLINVELSGATFEDTDFEDAFISLKGYDEEDLVSLLNSKNLWEAIIYPEEFNATLIRKAKMLLSDPDISYEFKDKLKIYLTQKQ